MLYLVRGRMELKRIILTSNSGQQQQGHVLERMR